MEKGLTEKVYPHEISQRINTLIFRFCQGNKTLFAKSIGVSQQRINRLFNIDSRTNKYPKPSDDIIEAIFSCYPEVDKVWLLTGEGGIISVKESSISIKEEEGEMQVTGYYYPNVDAAVGLDRVLMNDDIEKVPVHLPNFGKGIDFINVYGDSMYPRYNAGEIMWNKIYGIPVSQLWLSVCCSV